MRLLPLSPCGKGARGEGKSTQVRVIATRGLKSPLPVSTRDHMADDWIQKLLKNGTISKEQFAEGKALADKLGVSVGEALQKLEYISASDMGQAQAQQFGMD